MLIYLSCIIKAVSHLRLSITLIVLKVNGVGITVVKVEMNGMLWTDTNFDINCNVIKTANQSLSTLQRPE